MRYIYDNIIFGDLNTIDNIVRNILCDITPLLNEDLCFDIRLVLSELLINSHQHGNCYDCDKSIQLRIDLGEDCIDIFIKDEGTGQIIKRDCKKHREKSNGRGLVIVEALVDVMTIENNIIKCKIYLTS